MESGRPDDPCRTLQWHLLRSFVRVVELGSVRRAAKALYLAPSAVSTHVSSLTAAVGVPLLERRDGVLAPTPVGLALCEGARDLLERARELDRRLRSLGERPHPLRIVSTSTGGASGIGTLAAGFLRAQPDVGLSLCGVPDPGAAEAALHRGAAHFAVLDRDALAGDRAAIPVGEETTVVVVPPRHRWARRRTVDVAELAGQPFVVPPPGCDARRFLARHLGERLAEVVGALETEDEETLRSAVTAGLAGAFVGATRAERLALPALRLTGADLTRRFALVRGDGDLDVTAQRFWTWCDDAVRCAKTSLSA